MAANAKAPGGRPWPNLTGSREVPVTSPTLADQGITKKATGAMGKAKAIPAGYRDQPPTLAIRVWRYPPGSAQSAAGRPSKITTPQAVISKPATLGSHGRRGTEKH